VVSVVPDIPGGRGRLLDVVAVVPDSEKSLEVVSADTKISGGRGRLLKVVAVVPDVPGGS